MIHTTTVTPRPGSRNIETGEPLFDWECRCETADYGLDTRADAERAAEAHLLDVARRHPEAFQLDEDSRFAPVAVYVLPPSERAATATRLHDLMEENAQ
ncbi:hypothetical protein [Amycolatopsis sp. PS_44_ISF1]|uniref:hypothetical protein n=1 Tax=Amycolatopsis sp. PS_44_ISF1 TaxID=2974917 RepID=UPI0028DE0C74|nr:hypothetical protein [Amycolatopsis sp. PS_44_ISF1]MDT8915814.1 hypothetical protein [Amycolatopsis sp. PS_44_ISF1]